MAKRDVGHLANLDVLRAIAILLVFFFHVQGDLVPGFRFTSEDYDGLLLKDGTGARALMWNLIPSAFGASGVELFLLISGFLIHLAWLRTGTSLNLPVFFSKRFWRIYPPYLVSIALLLPITTHQGWSDILLHALLLHNLNEASFFSINPSYWSLALEAQLYLVYPVLLWMRSVVGFRRSLLLLFGLSLIASIHQFVVDAQNPVLDKSLLKFWLFWAVGAFLAEEHHLGRKVFMRHSLLLVIVGAVITLSKFTTLHQPLKFYLYTLFHAVLLEYSLTWSLTNGKVIAKRMVQFMVVIGLCSYSFYLYHQPILRWYLSVRGAGHGALGVTMFILILFIIVLVVSWCVYKFIELPSIELGRRLRGARKRLAA